MGKWNYNLLYQFFIPWNVKITLNNFNLDIGTPSLRGRWYCSPVANSGKAGQPAWPGGGGTTHKSSQSKHSQVIWKKDWFLSWRADSCDSNMLGGGI